MNNYPELLKILDLADINLVHIESDKLQESSELSRNLKIEYKLHYLGEPQVNETDGIILYQVKVEIFLYDASTKEEKNNIISKMVLGYFIVFKCTDVKIFKELYQDTEIKEFFTKIQVTKTLWPYVRQQHADLSNRHALRVPPLPWIK